MLALRGDIKTLKDLPFFGVHIPLRKVEFGLPELGRLAGYARLAIGEHLLTTQVVFGLAASLKALDQMISVDDATAFVSEFNRLLSLSGGQPGQPASDADSKQLFETVRKACEEEVIKVRQYYTRAPFDEQAPAYNGALTGFLDFLVPLSTVIKNFASLNNVPIFVMLDDADNLPRHLQRLLNSWVSTRSTHVVCLKITTQLGYATYRTVDNRLIESPHDFSEVNLSTIYTSDLNNYSRRVAEIVARRFKLADIKASVDEFFPIDTEQAASIEQICLEIEKEHTEKLARGEKGAARPRDEVLRQAVPRYMTTLAGRSKSSHTYSYAGFRSLVDLSSGVVRWFLEPASQMYDRVASDHKGVVNSIPVGVQDRVALDWSSEFRQKLSVKQVAAPSDDGEPNIDLSDASLHAIGHEPESYDRLRNLLDGLGSLFRMRLLDESASERRVFSIVIRGKPDRDLEGVLDLGVRLGYLQKADNAAKEKGGLRLPRYIMARRLGPYYRLDVSGYAVHFSVMASTLAIAMREPKAFVRARLKEETATTNQLGFDLGYDGNDSEA
jgi:hypothetical protein